MIGIVFAVIAIGVIVLIGVMASRDSKATKTNLARWNALVHITRCLRDGTLPDFVLTTTAAVQDPRKPNLMFPQFSAVPESECLADLDTLAGAPAFASQIAALTEWQESLQNVITEETKLAAYYHHADWKDDRYQAGEAMWKAAQLAAHQQHDAVVVILAHVVPIIESEAPQLRQRLRSEARPGRDDVDPRPRLPAPARRGRLDARRYREAAGRSRRARHRREGRAARRPPCHARSRRHRPQLQEHAPRQPRRPALAGGLLAATAHEARE